MQDDIRPVSPPPATKQTSETDQSGDVSKDKKHTVPEKNKAAGASQFSAKRPSIAPIIIALLILVTLSTVAVIAETNN